jgi:hypothetical protein
LNRLIDVIGGDGSFIMAYGCEVPKDTTFEDVNLRRDVAFWYHRFL